MLHDQLDFTVAARVGEYKMLVTELGGILYGKSAKDVFTKSFSQEVIEVDLEGARRSSEKDWVIF